jgi:hypothetical protein
MSHLYRYEVPFFSLSLVIVQAVFSTVLWAFLSAVLPASMSTAPFCFLSQYVRCYFPPRLSPPFGRRNVTACRGWKAEQKQQSV